MGSIPGKSAPSTEVDAIAFGPGYFLSYPRTEPLRGDRSDPDYWIKSFFHELAAEVRALDGSLQHGFIAGHVPPGADPETLTARSLANCRIFVPLYSDDYFEDERCGREWAVFEQRRRLRRARTGEDGDSIVPVLWTRQGREDWPPCAYRLSTRRLILDELYQRLGLFELIRLHERAYREVVRLLARGIVLRAHTEAPPPAAQDALSWAAPAFPPPGRSTHRMFITVVAGIRRTLPPDRDPEYYGDRPEDWRPYQPESAEPIVTRAARIARSLGYRPEITVLTSASPETKANGPHKPSDESHLYKPSAASILLADPWLFRGFQERHNLETVDRRRKEWVRLMVPWCAADRETAENRTVLEGSVRNAVPWMIQGWQRTCPRSLVDLATPEEFDEALPTVIDRARSHFLNNVGTLRDASGKGHPGRPRLAPPLQDEQSRHGPG